ncbi:MAG: nucleotidyltransferase family protein [Fimbriimonadaceae bacterium]|nr:nucleotidyltransferase family protein [Fimbriimonadaceae bacterium]
MSGRFNAVAELTIPLKATLRDAVTAIDRNLKGIVFVVDEKRRLLDSLTDGDIRRALLAGATFEDSVEGLRFRPERQKRPRPITAGLETSRADILALMRRHKVAQIPVVDESGTLMGLYTLSDLTPDVEDSIEAVVMAGGFGQRLRPLTEDTPKPMLPVGDRPLLEHIVRRLRTCGIKDVHVTTHYRPDVIRRHFGDGAEFGVNMNYVNEDEPLGTAGALRLLERPQRTMLVMNGDILTSVDFRRMKAYHDEQEALLSVAVRAFEVNVPYGVIEEQDGRITGLREKPTYRHFVSAGIYMLDPRVFDYLGEDGRVDMTDLIHRLIGEGQTVASFPLTEYWLDIGHHKDYIQAQEDVLEGLV